MQCLTIIDDDVGKEFIGNKLQLMYNILGKGAYIANDKQHNFLI